MSLSLHRLVALGLFGTAFLFSLSSPAYAAPFAYVSSSGDCAELGTAVIQVIDTATDTVVGTLLNVDRCPDPIVMDANGRRLYAGNARAVPFDVMPDVVGIIDPARDRFVGRRRADEVVAMAASQDGRRIYALSQSARELRVINTNGKRQTRVPLPGSVQWCIAATPDGRKVYACIAQIPPPGDLAVYDAATLELVTTIALPGGQPQAKEGGLTILPDSSKLYATMWLPAKVAVVDASSDTVIGEIPIDMPGGQDFLNKIIVTPNGSKVYATQALDPGSGGPVEENIVIIDPVTDIWVNTVPLPLASGAVELAVTPDAQKKLYVLASYSQQILVIDTATDTITSTIPLPTPPKGVYIDLTIGPPGGLRRGKLYLVGFGNDRLKLKGAFTLEGTDTFDPATEALTVTLSDANGEFYSATIPPGSFADRGSRLSFRDASGMVAGGIKRMDIRKPQSPTDAYMDYTLSASRIDLSGADRTDITIELAVGTSTISVSRPFVEKGASLRYP